MDKEGKKLKEGWAWTIEELDGIASAIKKLAVDNVSSTSCSCSDDMNIVLLQIEHLADALDQVGFRSAELLAREEIELEQEEREDDVGPDDRIPYDYESDGNDGVAWDESQNCSPFGEQQCPIQQDVPPNKSISKRSKNFNEKEDEMLVLGWLNISMDPSQDNEQSRSTYWKRINAYFHENKDFVSDRSQNSFMHRWSTIQEHVNKFCGCYDRILRRRQSGVTEQDKILQACVVYKEEEGKAFQYLHCWNILQHHPKWTDRLSQKKHKVSAHSSPGTSSPISTNASCFHDEGEAPTPESDSLKRPIGKKAGKSSNSSTGGDSTYMEALDNMWAKKREVDVEKELKKDERHQGFIAVQQEKAANAKVKLANEQAFMANEARKVLVKEQEVQLKKRPDDQKIMDMYIRSMVGAQAEYYMSL